MEIQWKYVIECNAKYIELIEIIENKEQTWIFSLWLQLQLRNAPRIDDRTKSYQIIFILMFKINVQLEKGTE